MNSKQEFDPSRLFSGLLAASKKTSNTTLAHQVEHAGYGAILSRLMTGLNLSLALDANYYFQINSFYQIENLFDIAVKQPLEEASKNQIIKWDFFQDTWNADPQIRAEHQFPCCPLTNPNFINRHQWSAILAYAICGNPKPILRECINKLKHEVEWEARDLCVGLHVRRGDKNTECPYISTERYMDFLTQVSAQNPGKSIGVYLASDDPDTMKIFSKYENSSLHFIWDREEPRYNNYNAKMVSMDPNLAFQESLTAAKNICLLGECDYVIGMSTAQFTWIGGLLSAYKNQLDVRRHIMIDPFTGYRGHWASYYGFAYKDSHE